MAKKEEIFEKFLNYKKLKHSEQRIKILKIIMNIEKHLTTDELYRIVNKKYPSMGYSTVYRTLKLLCECGLCQEVKFEDNITRYEHRYGHEHHDHLICMKCGEFIEVVDPEIEKLQKRLTKKYKFHQQHHHMEIYGICSKCNKKM